MRRLLIRGFLLSLVVVGGAVLGQSSTSANPQCKYVDPVSGQCIITVEVEPEPPTPTPNETDDSESASTGSGAACHWDPAKQGLARPPAGSVPCTSEHGYWSDAYNCYIERLDPQPPPTAPFWEGAYVEGGAVYQCYQPQTGMVVSLWLPEPPPGSGVGPTPGEVAQMAVDRMNLRASTSESRRSRGRTR